MSFQNALPFFLGFVVVIIPYSLLFALNISFLLIILYSLYTITHGHSTVITAAIQNITDNSTCQRIT